jgi:uncharacterized membrane protein
MRKSLPFILIAVALAASLWTWPRLPDTLPTHWDSSGRVDGTSSKPFALFLIPSIAAAVAVALRLLPGIDPRQANYEKFRSSYDLMVTLTVATLVAIHLATIASALGWPIPVTKVVAASVGVLLVAIGNFLPRARPNFFFGIRTPWTLSSDSVWMRTHRVGGYALVAGGLLQIVVALVGESAAGIWPVAIILAISIGLVAYSYLLWRREHHPS